MKSFSRTARRAWAGLTAAGLAAGLLLAPAPASAGRDVGYPERATISVPEGKRTLHLELVPDMAVVRFGAFGEATLDDVSAGSAILSDLSEVGRLEAGGLTVVKAQEGSQTALNARSAGAGLADSLYGSPVTSFTGPVFKVGDRILGTSDRLNIKFSTGTTIEQQRQIVQDLGATVVKSGEHGFWTVSIPTDDGFDTINKMIEANSIRGVSGASVDWVHQLETKNMTGTFNGTSAAAPMVSGVAGLILSANPGLRAEEVIYRTKLTANFVDNALATRVPGDRCLRDYGPPCDVPASSGFDVCDRCVDAEGVATCPEEVVGLNVAGIETSLYTCSSCADGNPIEVFFNGTGGTARLGCDTCGTSGNRPWTFETQQGGEWRTCLTCPNGSQPSQLAVAGQPQWNPDGTPVLTCSQGSPVDVTYNTISPVENPPYFAGPDLPFSPYYGFGIANARGAVENELGVGSGAPVAFSDPLQPYQWHLDRGNQPDAAADADMDVALAWRQVRPDLQADSDPSKVRVAVIDDGVAMNHPDLNIASADAYDAASNTLGTAQPRQGTGHGTSVAGIIAARANGRGGVGVLPGNPIIGVRLIGAPGFVSDSQIYDSFEFAVSRGADVINNSWGPVTPDADNCGGGAYEAPASFSEIEAVTLAVVAGRGGLGSVVVFAAGNDSLIIDFAGSGAAGPALLYLDRLNYEPETEFCEWWGGDCATGTPGVAREAILTVSATNNVANPAFYTSFGESVDIAGPSGETFPGGLACANEVWGGGILGIVTTDVNLLELGGSQFDTAGYGALGFMGIFDWSAIDFLWTDVDAKTPFDDSVNNRVFENRGVIFPTPSGQINLLAGGIFTDLSGAVGGIVELRVRDDNDLVTQRIFLPATGRARFARKGTFFDKETYGSSLAIKGKGTVGGIPAAFSVRGRERFVAIEGIVTETTTTVENPDGSTTTTGKRNRVGFLTNSSVRIAGAGNERKQGTYYRYGNPNGARLGYRIGSIYSPDVTNVAPKTTKFAGTAFTDYLEDTIGSGAFAANVRYATPGRPGTVKASAKSGGIRATSQGTHTADATQPFIELVDVTHFPRAMTFRVPGASTSLKNNRVPTNLPND